MRTYLIIRKGYAERCDWAGGFLGTVMDWSKKRALKKAAKRFGVPLIALQAFYQPE